jgi:hypothetical protein
MLPIVLTLFASAATASALETDPTSRFELSMGTSSLFVLGPMSGVASVSLDASASGAITHGWWWTGGARLGLGAWLPEAFARITAAPRVGDWAPAAGLELGVSARADDDAGSALLAEARAQASDGLSPIYVAVHASPLRFHVFERFRVSVLELQLGTYVTPFGRYVRAQIGLIAAGIAL